MKAIRIVALGMLGLVVLLAGGTPANVSAGTSREVSGDDVVPTSGAVNLIVNDTNGDTDMFIPNQAVPVHLDSVNIGDTTSEAGHNLVGWSDSWVGCGWCSDDGNMRAIWGDGGETCEPANNWASLELDAGSYGATKLTIQHLDTAGDEGFNVYVNGDLVGTYVNFYPSNTWVTTDFNIAGGTYTGLLTIKLEATAISWSYCPTYGQVHISWIELEGVPFPVGGIGELPDVAGTGDTLPRNPIIMAAVTGAIAFGAGAWYARRRWLA